MTPKERALKALNFEKTDIVPFTCYSSKLYACEVERLLRNRGLCSVERKMQPYTQIMPNVKISEEVHIENNRRMVRHFWETPVGTVSYYEEQAGFTNWIHEHLFKKPEDYKVLKFIIEDCRYEENYAAYDKFQKQFGGDVICRASFGSEPLQALISSHYFDMQQFCMEWMDNRDEIISLYHAIVEQKRKLYKLVSESPASHINYGGNVVPEIISPAMHKEYYLPHYEEAAAELHKNGIKLGSHYDANCKSFAENLAESALDYIEAFTPAPDTDLTLKEAREFWPDKVLWLNFPSSVHLKSDEFVEKTTVELLASLDSTDGIIMGITEDVPPERWQGSFTAIMDAIYKFAEAKSLI